MCSKEKFTGSSALSRSISENTLVDALHKVSVVVRIKVQQHSTSNEHLDIVHGLETLETPPEAYQAFLMPMTLPRLPRELTMKWKRGRTDEKNSLKELLTFLKAEIRIRERYGSFDSSARVDSEIQNISYKRRVESEERTVTEIGSPLMYFKKILRMHDIKLFVGALVKMGIILMPRYRMYWSTDFRVDSIANQLTLNRFMETMR
ncbi:hypothetical protein T10_10292 [Trichinella papuae]|uniref:PiggyBac transposable element-derived protein domain-containing protein n=1 Tax=Trichinella papuae TaxID=268474 RepID=A0A0V1N6A7_9BILA|nr:hypothetical protein T10_10292 [Trichinella papuae]